DPGRQRLLGSFGFIEILGDDRAANLLRATVGGLYVVGGGVQAGGHLLRVPVRRRCPACPGTRVRSRQTACPSQDTESLEVGGIGPGPFCGMLLADLVADVVVIDRVQAGPQDREINAKAIVRRGKRAIALDLKTSQGVQALCTLLAHADGLIEGMRPGVMERLGVGPDECLSLNPGLVYGRVTGWGQHGPLAQAAGHDINYLALSGGLWY